MALSKPTLVNEFLKLIDRNNPAFAGYPATKIDAVTNWCNAYNTYAMSAQDASLDFLVTSNLSGMITTLFQQLPDAVPTATGAQAAAAFDAAFVTYWTGAVFAVGIPIVPVPPPRCPNIPGPHDNIWGIEISSVVSTVTSGILQNGLDLEFAILSDDAVVKADALADSFHVATTTAVLVLISGTDTTPSPSGPLPITNLCTIS